MHVRGVHFVWLGAEIVGLMIPRMDPLCPRPLVARITWIRKLLAQLRSPLAVVLRVEGSRVEGGQAIAAHALFVFHHQAQLWLERQVWPDKNSSKRVGIVAIKRLAVAAVIA